MSAFQASLLDASDRIGFNPLVGCTERRILGAGAWLDIRVGWVTGADSLFAELHRDVTWRAERRPMYDRVVDVPRMLSFYGEGQPLPHPALEQAKQLLDGYYTPQFGEPFATAGLCLYRDGRDSVAWHGDTVGRSRSEDTLVAIVCLGAVRPLQLRPVGGGETIRNSLGHGDLIVMGGSCQRTWQHSIAKTNRAVGPRISVQFRSRGVR